MRTHTGKQSCKSNTKRKNCIFPVRHLRISLPRCCCCAAGTTRRRSFYALVPLSLSLSAVRVCVFVCVSWDIPLVSQQFFGPSAVNFLAPACQEGPQAATEIRRAALCDECVCVRVCVCRRPFAQQYERLSY